MTFNLHANLTIADLVALLSPADREFLRQFVEEIGRNLEPLIFASEYFDAAILDTSAAIRTQFHALMMDYLNTPTMLNGIYSLYDTVIAMSCSAELRQVAFEIYAQVTHYWSIINGYTLLLHETPTTMTEAKQIASHQKIYRAVCQLIAILHSLGKF